jgi:hypothetical protein
VGAITGLGGGAVGYRRLARLLASEGDLARREGRPDTSLQSSLDILRLGSRICENSGLLARLTGAAISSIGLAGIELALPTASAEAATTAARNLYELDRAAPTYLEALRVEREYGAPALAEELRQAPPGVVARTWWEITRANGRMPDPPAVQNAFHGITTPRRTILAEYLRNLDDEIQRAAKPYQNCGPAPTHSTNSMIAGMQMVDGDTALFFATRLSALRRIMAARLAVRAFTAREGHPPSRVAMLVPRYLPAIPEDPFAAVPLSYRVTNGVPLVYSRGPDGDDDKGRDLGSRLLPGMDGDLASMRRPAGP